MNMLKMALLFPVALAAGPVAMAQEVNDLSFQIVRSNLNAFDDQQFHAAFERVAERTGSQLKVSTIFAGALPIESSEWLRAVGSGDLDMTMIVGDYHAGDFPLLGLLQTPFLFRDQVEKNLAINATFPIMQREANKRNIQLLTSVPFGELGFWTTEPVEDISSMEGVKLRAQSKLLSEMVEAMGGEPVPVAWAEVYTALPARSREGRFLPDGNPSRARSSRKLRRTPTARAWPTQLPISASTRTFGIRCRLRSRPSRWRNSAGPL